MGFGFDRPSHHLHPLYVLKMCGSSMGAYIQTTLYHCCRYVPGEAVSHWHYSLLLTFLLFHNVICVKSVSSQICTWSKDLDKRWPLASQGVLSVCVRNGLLPHDINRNSKHFIVKCSTMNNWQALLMGFL